MFTYLDINYIAAEATILRRARQMEAAVCEGCVLLMDISYSPQHQDVVFNVISIWKVWLCLQGNQTNAKYYLHPFKHRNLLRFNLYLSRSWKLHSLEITSPSLVCVPSIFMLNSFMIMVGSSSLSCSRSRVGSAFTVHESRRINWASDTLLVVSSATWMKIFINLRAKIKTEKLKIISFHIIKFFTGIYVWKVQEKKQ